MNSKHALLLAVALCFSSAPQVAAAEFTVFVSDDIGPGTLRQAIIDANASPGSDVIVFSVGMGPISIAPTSALPSVTDPVIINGASQPGFSNAPIVEIAGNNAGSGVSGFRLFSSNCVIRSLIINRFAGNGIVIASNGYNTVEGCYVGLGLHGTNDAGNTLNGVAVTNSPGNLIGGLGPSNRNIISGNNQHGIHITGSLATNNLVLGNWIGLGINDADLGNGANGVFLNGAPNNQVGSEQPGARNVISGNASDGVEINGATARHNVVQGNFIGTDSAGLLDRGNTGDGVSIANSIGTLVGGATQGQGNLIAGNESDGLGLTQTSSNRVFGNWIGTDATGLRALGNRLNGLTLASNARTNFIGGTGASANIIAFNGDDGINIGTGANTNNVLRGNRIFNNGELGIDLLPNGVTLNDADDPDSGANLLQNFPTLTAATNSLTNTIVIGLLYSRANTLYTLDFYSNSRCDESDHGEGETHLGAATVMTDAIGSSSFSVDLPIGAVGLFITATATDPFGNTSEFSPCQRSVSLVGSQVFTVVNTNDSGPGSLRQALGDSDQLSGSNNIISFAIPGPGVQTIQLLSPLPPVSEKVTIDGFTQPGARCNALSDGYDGILLIRLDGGNLPGAANGLEFYGNGNVVRGLVVGHFAGHGIVFTNGSGNVLEGCLIGIDADGSTLFTNRGSGVRLNNSANNRIGGSTPCARNVISGNGISTSGNGIEIAGQGSTNNSIQGCFIGTDASGLSARGNSPNGIRVFLGSGNMIGGSDTGAGNLISGNNHPSSIFSGVRVVGINSGSGAASNNVIQGNIIGLDRTGGFAIPNSVGVFIEFAPSNLVGGSNTASRNVISGNRLTGIEVNDVDQAVNNVIQGNFIGTDLGGGLAIGNGLYGIDVGATRAWVGGPSAAPGMPPGNVISGNGSFVGSPAGILLNSPNNVVLGNLIGTDATGTLPLGNFGDAIRSANGNGNTYGGTAPGSGNVIASTRRASGGQASGLNLAGSTNNQIFGNWIGVDASGTRALGNERHGILISSAATLNNLHTVIGGATPNVIAFNGSNGVHFASPIQGTSNVLIRGNSFFRNGGLAIDLTAGTASVGITPNDPGDADNGANTLQNFPYLNSALFTNGVFAVQGVLDSTPGDTFTIDVYASTLCNPRGNGEGQFHIGSVTVTTDAGGTAAFSIEGPPVPSGFAISATATHATGGTSEFSPCTTVAGSLFPRVLVDAMPGEPNRYQLAWQRFIGPWSIQSATNLAPPVHWIPISIPVIADGDFLRVLWTNHPGEPQRFFRLALVDQDTNTPLTLLRGPYLQIGTPQSMVVKWRTSRPAIGRVQYGVTADDLNLTAEGASPQQEHEIMLQNLTPGTRYFYSVGTLETNFVRSTNHFFWTAPSGPKPTRIWVIGDAGTINYGNPGQVAVRNAFNTFNAGRYIDVWLMLGDNAYETGTDAEYQTAVFNMYTNLLPQTPLWPALGNHDTAYSHTPVPTTPYLGIFSLPQQGDAGGVPSGTERYYSFNHENIHFICLDSMTSERTTNGAMANWLRADLEANTSLWTIVYFHHPPYSKGSHDSDDRNGFDFELVQMRQNINPILESYGVDLVLSGHSHSYERSYLMKGHYGFSTNLEPAMILNSGGGAQGNGGPYVKTTDGTVYVVAGSSGQVSFTQPDWPHPIMYRPLLQLGSVIIDIDGNQLVAQFIRETTQVTDTFTLIKQPPPVPLRFESP